MGNAKQNRFNADALCRSEQRILTLWDAGQSIERITRATGYRKRTVAETVGRLSDGGETRLHIAAMQSGSAELLAALVAAR